ncbi:ATP-dependent DNA helicase RecG [Clostridia bacterium]|nr:ATP-dependent DNA helicase RecG [Clostridia bacterium]
MDLTAPIKTLKGIGEKTAETLNDSGIFTIRDLLYYLPRTYENFQEAKSIANLKPGKVTLKAKVENIATKRTKSNIKITEAVLKDDSGSVRAVWFNQPYREKQFKKDLTYYFTGPFEFSYGRYQLSSPTAVLSTDLEKRNDSKLVPIYPKKAETKSNLILKTLKSLKPAFATIPDLLPEKKGRAEALFKTHFPESESDIEQGRAYLAFEELFSYMLAGKLNKIGTKKLKSTPVKFNLTHTRAVLEKLPFKLTEAQRKATWEIIKDLEKTEPMNRLLQGDVGSGKTVVAALAMASVANQNGQSALLAPTEILATQHAEDLYNLLTPLGIKVSLLTGSTKNKKQLKQKIKQGETDIIIGTHALLTDDTVFKNLTLTIIDEQHRFGVAQRQKLLSKINHPPDGTTSSASRKSLEPTSPSQMPHLLSMTATPIPRSLQLTIFGDLNISILNELPKGRKKIETKIITPINTAEMWRKIKQNLRNNQAYYICKTIEESEKSDLKNVKKETEKLKTLFPEKRVEYLHGKMKPAEKDEIMQKFAKNEINILVSTTVIEVGVNVPNATIIVIADADKYGLSQLHQLRGRVGRGTEKSYCYLINSNNETVSKRLRELENSTDGFYLSEVDLSLRGPGAIYGTLQHGILDLKIATLTDTKLIKEVAKAVENFEKTEENMLKYKELRETVEKYQRLTTLN